MNHYIFEQLRVAGLVTIVVMVIGHFFLAKSYTNLLT